MTTLELTPKQIESILTALFEWAQIEAQTKTGAKQALAMRQAHTAILNQISELWFKEPRNGHRC